MTISLVVFAGLVYGCYLVAARAFRQLTAAPGDLGKAIVTAGATIVVAVIALVFGKMWEQKVRLREELRQRKQPVYETQVHLLFSVLFASREGATTSTEQDIFKAFREFTEKLLIWGGPEVIKKWSAFRLHPWGSGTPEEGFLKFETFVRAMRAELGNKNSGLAHGDLLHLFINDLDPAKLHSIAVSASRPPIEDAKNR
jgi:hypothetical protein